LSTLARDGNQQSKDFVVKVQLIEREDAHFVKDCVAERGSAYYVGMARYFVGME